MRKNLILILLLTFSIACATETPNGAENVSKRNANNVVAAANETENKNLAAPISATAKTPNSNSAVSNNSPDSAERIKFKPGATSANVGGTLKNYEDAKNFLIEVKRGQTLRTEQIKEDNSLKYVTVEIQDSKGEYVGDSDASCNNRKEIKLTAAGDYRIKVKECQKADAWRGEFLLKISVE